MWFVVLLRHPLEARRPLVYISAWTSLSVSLTFESVESTCSALVCRISCLQNPFLRRRPVGWSHLICSLLLSLLERLSIHLSIMRHLARTVWISWVQRLLNFRWWPFPLVSLDFLHACSNREMRRRDSVLWSEWSWLPIDRAWKTELRWHQLSIPVVGILIVTLRWRILLCFKIVLTSMISTNDRVLYNLSSLEIEERPIGHCRAVPVERLPVEWFRNCWELRFVSIHMGSWADRDLILTILHDDSSSIDIRDHWNGQDSCMFCHSVGDSCGMVVRWWFRTAIQCVLLLRAGGKRVQSRTLLL